MMKVKARRYFFYQNYGSIKKGNRKNDEWLSNGPCCSLFFLGKKISTLHFETHSTFVYFGEIMLTDIKIREKNM